MIRFAASIAALALVPGAAAGQAPIATAVIADAPRDAGHPAAMAYVRIPSGGSLINGLVYTAAGGGAHPVLVLLHGFPGNEQNLDLAQAVRRAGFDVLTLHYRGSWGSAGAFTFTHARADADAAIAFLRVPANAAKFGVDPKRIFVAGHSMGGFMAASAAARDPHIAGLIMISAWNMVEDGRGGVAAARARAHAPDSEMAEDVIPLGGATVDALIGEIAAAPDQWDFTALAPKIAPRPVLLVSAEDGSVESARAMAARLAAAGDHDVQEVHMITDHPYSDHRLALASQIVRWLDAHR